MTHEPTVPMCADLSAYLSPSVIRPRAQPINVLRLGDSSSIHSKSSEAQELELERDIKHPIRTESLDICAQMTAAFPVHLPWTMFPVISEPWFKFHPTGNSRLRNFLTARLNSSQQSEFEIADVFDQFDAFVINANTSSDAVLALQENLVKMSYAVAKLGEGKPCFLAELTHSPGNVEPVSSGEKFVPFHVTEVKIEDVMNMTRAYGVLIYSYRLNFKAIAMKALRAALRGVGRPSIHDVLEQEPGSILSQRHQKQRDMIVDRNIFNPRLWQTLRPVRFAWSHLNEGLVPAGLDHPLTLQVLYAVRKSGAIDVSEFLAAGGNGVHLFGSIFGANPVSKNRDVWLGSGKYRGQELGLSGRGGFALLALGLVAIDFKTSTLSITNVGNRFLDYLHSSCEDPDVILRWMDHDTGLFRPGSEAGVVDWLNAFFRKMKTRVNQIQE